MTSVQRDLWATGRRPYMESPMKYDPTKHHRRSIRLPGYDYATPGAYFVTIATYHNVCLFGKILNDEMQITNLGMIIEEHWRGIPDHFPNVELGTFVVMPNHIHGIIILHADPIRGVVSTPEILHDHSCRGVVSTPEISHDDSRRGVVPTPIFTVPQGDETSPLQRPTLGQVVAYFKYQSTKHINTILDSVGTPIWQRNFYEHIIRNEDEHERIHLYIESNPVNWMDDDENPR